MMTIPPAMPPAMGPMEELLLDVAGGEGAATPGLVRSATGTVTGGRPSICTTTLTDVTFAPTPEDATHHARLRCLMRRCHLLLLVHCSATFSEL